MPKISAPTVAEHRGAQRAALIRAAEAVLLEGGLATVSPRTVTERAGLARSSFYDYFPSKDDLLVAVALQAFDRWNDEISAELAKSAPGLDRLRAFVEATLRMTADGRHGLATSLREAELTPKRHEGIDALHAALFRPLAETLAELGHSDAALWMHLAQGVLGAGVQLVEHGADHRTVAEAAFQLLTHGLPA
ncbi:TetR/AcrR family transcriptional regulator [Sinomonas sp. ASV486]|uniref:TetR/AcrR family transcriptional regulator n=1 Tax=Sinomonas sp. ASV486 TaxID=3051170 RepID=UPI0027DD7BAA|nr:TetR/AcrR family transcriptional regulator [Sinomonas sp. ASV486]MDQ4489375.1 TetR/AcrR family transcriptional regulator [Sinomonas sp. ASV486]